MSSSAPLRNDEDLVHDQIMNETLTEHEKDPLIPDEDPGRRNNHVLALVLVALIIGATILWAVFTAPPPQGPTDQIIRYGSYEFYTYGPVYVLEYQVGNTILDLQFNYLPQDVLDIPVEGGDLELVSPVYLSFDPSMTNESLGALQQSFLNTARKLIAFGFEVQAACTQNTDPACEDRPIVTCDDDISGIVYYEASDPRIIFDGTCATVYGFSQDLVRAENRIMYMLLGII